MADFHLTNGADLFIGEDSVADLFFGRSSFLTSDDTISGGNTPGDSSVLDTLHFTTAGTVDASAFDHVQGIEMINLSAGGNDVTLTDPLVRSAQGNTITVHGHAGNDVVDAHLVTFAGHVNISGGMGDDVLTGGGIRSNIDGGQGDDTIFGGYGSDNLKGSAGVDHIFGGLGDETIHGNLGDDVIHGGAGSDSVGGNYGADMLFGGSGDDHLSGEEGSDKIYGQTGNDVLAGSVGHDTIYGGEGADSITGGDGHDIINGGAGSDTLQGDGGRDRINLGNSLGDGDHVVYAQLTDGAATGTNVGYDRVFGGDATDKISFTGDGSVDRHGVSLGEFNTGGAHNLDDIVNDDTFQFATDGMAANFDTTDEAARHVFASDTDVTDLATVAAAFNATGVTASAGADALLVATGATHTGVYVYVEDGTTANHIDTSELTLLAYVNGALTTDQFDFLT